MPVVAEGSTKPRSKRYTVAVWAAVVLAVPLLCAMGFATWLHDRTVIVGRDVLQGSYVDLEGIAMLGIGQGYTARGDQDPSIRMHCFRVGDWGYTVRWWKGGATQWRWQDGS